VKITTGLYRLRSGGVVESTISSTKLLQGIIEEKAYYQFATKGPSGYRLANAGPASAPLVLLGTRSSIVSWLGTHLSGAIVSDVLVSGGHVIGIQAFKPKPGGALHRGVFAGLDLLNHLAQGLVTIAPSVALTATGTSLGGWGTQVADGGWAPNAVDNALTFKGMSIAESKEEQVRIAELVGFLIQPMIIPGSMATLGSGRVTFDRLRDKVQQLIRTVDAYNAWRMNLL
jgi:hypothetical protein